MSQSAGEVLRTLRKGDVFTVTYTLRATGSYGTNGVQAVEVSDDVPAYVFESPTMKVQVVKKARRPQRQDYDEGDVIGANLLREVQWVRGTVIERADEHRAAFVLREDGKWHDLLGPNADCECKSGWAFEDFAGDYRLVRLPK